jgi:uncharacterized protein YcgI (DUF1989 family)
MVTILADTLSWYGVDEHGGRVHDLLGTGCDPYINAVLTSGEKGDQNHHYDFHCRSNLTRAVLPYGLTEYDVHDVINLFQVTGLDEQGRYFMNPCPAGPGDYIEFFAEQDVLMALSMCRHPSRFFSVQFTSSCPYLVFTCKSVSISTVMLGCCPITPLSLLNPGMSNAQH